MQRLMPVSATNGSSSSSDGQRPYYPADDEATGPVGDDDTQRYWLSRCGILPFDDIDARFYPTDLAMVTAAMTASSSLELIQRRQRRQRQHQLMLMRMMYSSPFSSCVDKKTSANCLLTSLPKPPRADIEAIVMSTLSSVLGGHQQMSPPSAYTSSQHVMQTNHSTTTMAELQKLAASKLLDEAAISDKSSHSPSTLQTKICSVTRSGNEPFHELNDWQSLAPKTAPRMSTLTGGIRTGGYGNRGRSLEQRESILQIAGHSSTDQQDMSSSGWSSYMA
jgi:hypothetical protein